MSYFSCKVTRVTDLDEKSKRGYMIEIIQIIIGSLMGLFLLFTLWVGIELWLEENGYE